MLSIQILIVSIPPGLIILTFGLIILTINLFCVVHFIYLKKNQLFAVSYDNNYVTLKIALLLKSTYFDVVQISAYMG